MGAVGASRSWWSLPENFSTYEEYRNHLLIRGKYEGSSEDEILSLLALGPFCVFATWGFVTWNLGSLHSTQAISSKMLLLFEFIFILISSLVALTIGSDQIFPLLLSFAFAAVAFVLAIDRREEIMSGSGRKSKTLAESFADFRALDIPQSADPNGIDAILGQSIGEYRSLVLIVTTVCILAVDFPAVYPDRFHKSATFGTSIMDLGVGGFIVANGVVSREARTLSATSRKISLINRFQAGVVNLKKTFRASFLLAFLGLVRAFAVAITGYHVRVTEYGVHWNFFLTLAAVKLIASAIFTVIPHRWAWVMGLWNLIVYQMFLSWFGLQRVILFGTRALFWTSEEACSQVAASEADDKCHVDPRRGVVDANREGLFSIWGFLSLYFFSVQLGRVFFERKTKMMDWMKVSVILLIVSASSMIAYLAISQTLAENVLQPSRRIANASYILWTLSNCCIPIFLSLSMKMLTLFMSFQHGLRGRFPETILIRSINSNPLSFFLVANLLTGFVNLIFPTLLMDAISAMIILVVYLLSLTIFVYVLLSYRIRIS